MTNKLDTFVIKPIPSIAPYEFNEKWESKLTIKIMGKKFDKSI